jgi:RecA-family ATPase
VLGGEAKVDMAQLTGLHIPPMAGKDAVLATFNGRNGAMEPTLIWRKLEKLVGRARPKIIILDTLADIFGGDEISRRQTRSLFIVEGHPRKVHGRCAPSGHPETCFSRSRWRSIARQSG